MNLSITKNNTIRALLILLCSLAFGRAYSQKLLWQRQYGDSHFVHVSTVLPQPDRSIILAGYFKDRLQLGDYQMSAASDNPSHIACFLAKITADSVVRWATKVMDGGIVKDMARDGKGDFYLAGLMLNNKIKIGDDTLKSYAPRTSFLYKVSQAQNPLWASTGGTLPDSASPLNITFDQNEQIFLWGNYDPYSYSKQLNTGRWQRGVFAAFYRKDSGAIIYSRTSYDSNYRVYKVIFGNMFAYAFVGVKIKGQLHNGRQAENLLIQKIDLGSNPVDSILFERSAGFTFNDAVADNNGNIYMSGTLDDTLIMQGHYFLPKPGGARNMLASFTTGLSLNWLNTDTALATGAPSTLAFNRKMNRVAMAIPTNGNFCMAGKTYTNGDIGYLYAEADSFSGKIDYIKPILKAKKITAADYTGKLAIDTGGSFFYVMNYASVGASNSLSTVKGAISSNLKDKSNNTIPAFLTCWFTNDTVSHGVFNSIKPTPSFAESIKLYPNPAQHNMIISTSDIKSGAIVRIMDLQGRVINSYTVDLNHDNMFVDVSSLTDGMYMIDIQTATQYYTGRFIKN